MSVRVLTERVLKKANDPAFTKMMMELRQQALYQPGFISAEALVETGVSSKSHKYVIWSSWHSLDDWNNWVKSSRRLQTATELESIVEKPATHRIFKIVSDPLDPPLL